MPADRIAEARLSLALLPLSNPISDAKVFTGRQEPLTQEPLTQVAMLFAKMRTEDGCESLGFSYSKRAGGPGMYADLREIRP